MAAANGGGSGGGAGHPWSAGPPGLEHRADSARGNVRLAASPALPCSGQEGRAGYRVVWQS